jgi:pimeloyl-ACP methyl ester carboxylesterase
MTLRTRLGSRAMRRRAFLEMLYPTDHLAKVDPVELAKSVANLIGRDLADSPAILMKQVRALARHDLSTHLGALAGIPTLVLSGAHDLIAPPRFGRQLANLIPGARFEEIGNASHGMTLQEARLINQLLGKLVTASG